MFVLIGCNNRNLTRVFFGEIKMMRLDLLPKIRGDFFNFSEQIFSAIQVAKTSSELVHQEKTFNFRLFRYNCGGGTGKENQKKILRLRILSTIYLMLIIKW